MSTAPKPIIPETIVVAIVDTETTGLAEHDEPVSVGVVLAEVEMPKGKVLREVDAYYGTREPKVAINAQAAAVHGLTLATLRGSDLDAGRLRSMFARSDFVIAHHCAFDARMLSKLFPELAQKRWRCSVRQIWWSDFVPVANEKLDTICAHFGIARPDPHNALDDCRALLDALSRRTGKTDRSRTFLGAALAKDDFVFQPAQPARTPARTGSRTFALSKRAQIALGILVALVLLLVAISKK
ncbi:exonuclease domain-containing protein [Caballeronia sp. S22]|uniref:exonuclease domain-containing protein n=1 Tax=Caballeronia sp. S22 TaxID=3137182 RepID=UPI003530E710